MTDLQYKLQMLILHSQGKLLAQPIVIEELYNELKPIIELMRVIQNRKNNVQNR